ncbi:restriction endonuclease subunit S [Leuconostoc citreum]|uniref:restriction endonuclease subunit S n=1 Tax=Leuconostoc citreum TaxID=33964 RepID=UPI002958656D|nr:restriction endonuclease subunit S [Leuconostoc citreum]MDV8932150.1 restriction endonuclease subunit S [Leuconostoc citreum]
MSKMTPQIRFQGFTDDWEERKLSSGLREYTDRVIVEDDKEYHQISVRNNFGGITLRGSKMGNKIGRKRQAKINLTKYPQTLIFTRQTIEQGGIGWVDKYCDGAIVTENMPTISLDTSVFSKYFLTNLFQTRIFYKNAILDNVEGGSAQIAIHESKVLSSTLLFPNLDEQEKIGKFFKQLDNTIALHQRKLDLLKEQKKGFLQKMFPKNGAKVPELRFSGFADDWEERKLEDAAEIIDGDRGKNYPSGDDFKNSGHTLFLSATNVTKQGFVFKENQYITKLKSELLGNGKVNLNDIILTSRGSIGHIGLYDERINENIPHARINSGMLILRTDKFNSPSFIAQFLKAPLGIKQIKLISFGSAQPQLTKKDIKKFKITLPKIEEQIKIGAFLKQLDHTITLHQRKLNLLKEQKKGFLQKMFVS